MDQSSDAVEIVLEGGPAGVSPSGVHAEQDRLKIPHQGGYEHFERLDGEAAVYRWVARTKVAE